LFPSKGLDFSIADEEKECVNHMEAPLLSPGCQEEEEEEGEREGATML